MRKILLLFLAMFIGFGLSAQIYMEDFDSFSDGDYLAVVDGDNWTTWTNQPGTDEDAVISDAVSSSSPNSVLVEGTTDAVYMTGDLTSGAYVVSFDFYVPSGNAGYYNLQHVFASEWALECFMNADGSTQIDAGGQSITDAVFPFDTWWNVTVEVDMNEDWATMYWNDDMIIEFQWSLKTDGTPGENQLGCVNMYAGANGSDNPMYYFDNFIFDELSNVLYFEDFDDFADGDYLAVVDPENWTTWTNQPGTDEDALISDAQSETAPNSVLVDGTTDAVFPCGDLTSGAFGIMFDFYVPSGNAGYYNLQHVFASEWALECYLNADGSTQIDAGGQSITDAVFPFDTWWNVYIEVDMTNDWATMYWDDEMIIEFQWSLKTDGTPGENQLGCVNMYAGANGSDNPMYYFDNFTFISLSSALAPPSAEVDTDEFLVEISDGIAVTETFSLANVGEQDLEYHVYPVYDVEEASGSATGELSYCGDFDAGIGSDGAVSRKIAVLLNPDVQEDFIGTALTHIEFYMADQGLDFEVKVWEKGETTTPGPGEEIYAADYNPTVGAWNSYELTEPILLTGDPIYIGVSYFQPAGIYAMGSDIGPREPGVNWSSTGPGWAEFTLDRNWTLRGVATGDPMPAFMDVPVDMGMVLPGDDETIGVFFDPSDLGAGQYTGELVIASNDPENNYLYIDAILDIITSTNDINKTDALAVYPNPTTDLVFLRADANITEVRVSNYLGQLVEVYQMNETQSNIDMSQYNDGVYFLEVTTTGGVHTIKVVKK